ncbi:MAG: DUF72 domain-containing protein [Oscillatoriales cyanobacterium SM2_1_8]|nr:DUF72 domain-containing protein [Oscillatoriales cyanobacterium SM2_1_8]
MGEDAANDFPPGSVVGADRRGPSLWRSHWGVGRSPRGDFSAIAAGLRPDRFHDLQAFWDSGIPWPCPMALEVRHRRWFDPAAGDRLDAWLQSRGVTRAILDSRPIYDGETVPQLRPKPQLPLHIAATAKAIVVRYVSHPEGDRNEPYLREWVQRLQDWYRQQKQVYFFVHCPIEGRSPDNAQRLQTLLHQVGLDGKIAGGAFPNTTQLSLF